MSAQNAQIQGESDNRVCIVGVGASTAIGMDSPSTCAAVRAGIAGFADHPFMIDRNGEPMVVAMAPCLSEELGLTERCVELAKAAAAEAIEPLRGLPGSPGPVPLFIGLPESRPGLPNAFGGQMTESLTMVLRERIRTSNLSAISAGHSAGFLALKAGFEQLCTGRTDFCLVGGVDSYLEPETLEWLEENEQLHNTTNAYGFIPGEAAGFCLLARTQAAKEYGLTPLVNILAVTAAKERNLIKTETVCLGEGLTEAFRQAMAGLPAPETRIERIICDMNGEPYRADEYGFATVRLQDHFVDSSDFAAPADCWGDVGAASGTLFLNLVVASVLRGYAKTGFSLLWTSSEGGDRTAAVVQVPEQTRRTV